MLHLTKELNTIVYNPRGAKIIYNKIIMEAGGLHVFACHKNVILDLYASG